MAARGRRDCRREPLLDSENVPYILGGEGRSGRDLDMFQAGVHLGEFDKPVLLITSLRRRCLSFMSIL
jgi:hypothetical protein